MSTFVSINHDVKKLLWNEVTTGTIICLLCTNAPYWFYSVTKHWTRTHVQMRQDWETSCVMGMTWRSMDWIYLFIFYQFLWSSGSQLCLYKARCISAAAVWRVVSSLPFSARWMRLHSEVHWREGDKWVVWAVSEVINVSDSHTVRSTKHWSLKIFYKVDKIRCKGTNDESNLDMKHN